MAGLFTNGEGLCYVSDVSIQTSGGSRDLRRRTMGEVKIHGVKCLCTSSRITCDTDRTHRKLSVVSCVGVFGIL